MVMMVVMVVMVVVVVVNGGGGGGGDGDDDDDDDDIAFLQKSPNLPSAKSSLGSNIVLAKRWDQETSKSL